MPSGLGLEKKQLDLDSDLDSEAVDLDSDLDSEAVDLDLDSEAMDLYLDSAVAGLVTSLANSYEMFHGHTHMLYENKIVM